MATEARVHIWSLRVKNLWGSRLLLWQENHHMYKTVLAIFAPAPFTGFVRRHTYSSGWSKRYNYITKTRRNWYRVYKFFAAH